MKNISDLLKKLNISKVNMSKYLGVSRQMFYNYLALDKLEDWPEEKRECIQSLFGINTFDDIKYIEITPELKKEVKEQVDSAIKERKDLDINKDINDFEEESQKLLLKIFNNLKTNLEKDKKYLTTYNYLYYFLIEMDQNDDLKYVLSYFSKLFRHTPVNEYKYDRSGQYILEAILYTALNLYNNGSASEKRLAKSHEKFESFVQGRFSKDLTQTQELAQIRIEAMEKLNIEDVNDIDGEKGKELLDMIYKISADKKKK